MHGSIAVRVDGISGSCLLSGAWRYRRLELCGCSLRCARLPVLCWFLRLPSPGAQKRCSFFSPRVHDNARHVESKARRCLAQQQNMLSSFCIRCRGCCRGYMFLLSTVADPVVFSSALAFFIFFLEQVIDVKTKGILRAFREHKAPTRAVRWSCDGLQLASASDDKTVRLWDLPTSTAVQVSLSLPLFLLLLLLLLPTSLLWWLLCGELL